MGGRRESRHLWHCNCFRAYMGNGQIGRNQRWLIGLFAFLIISGATICPPGRQNHGFWLTDVVCKQERKRAEKGKTVLFRYEMNQKEGKL